MKRYLIQKKLTPIMIFTIALLLPSFSQQIEANAKNGVTCKKIGAKRIKDGNQFICAKQGKKLVWKKLPKDQANNGFAPIPSAAPSPTPKVSVSHLPSAAPSPTPKVSVSHPGWYQDAIKISRLARTTYIFERNNRLISPNFDTNLANSIGAYQSLSSSYWREMGFESSLTVTQVFLTEKDKAWFDEKVAINAPVVESFFSAGNPKNYFNGSVIIGRIPASSYFIIYFVGSEYLKSNPGEWKWRIATMATHEYQHLVQYHFTLTTSGINLQAELPCWFNEGMTSKFEDAFYLQETGSNRALSLLQDNESTENWFIDNRSFRIRTMITSIDRNLGMNVKTSWKLDDWYSFVVGGYRQDSEGCKSYRYGYLLGNILFEKLHMDHGTTRILSMFEILKQERSWRVAFEKSFGLNDLQWLKQVGLPYFIEQI